VTGFATIDKVDVKGKRVLFRADLNVPMKDGRVEDATRIDRVAPTIRELADKGARIVVLSHFGRPKGKRVAEDSLRPLVPALQAALGGRTVHFCDDCIGEGAEQAAEALQPGEVLLLENTRFHKGEEANDPDFAKALARLGDLYVNDAFSAAHRAHASTEGVAHLLPAYAGRLMQAELEALGRALEAPRHPVAAIVGGAKVSTKLDLLRHLLAKVDVLIIGGAMANTLLLAEGVGVGTSLAERDMIGAASDFLRAANAQSRTVLLPVDAVVAAALKESVPTATVGIGQVPADRMILDVGPKTAAAIEERLRDCRTLVWNGPVGAFETKPFDRGTNAVAQAVARLTKAGKLVSIAGGGDTVAALGVAGVVDDLTYVSTAGGAFLEWLEGRVLPGVAALQRA
jgi:phosphoglycerate kinase